MEATTPLVRSALVAMAVGAVGAVCAVGATAVAAPSATAHARPVTYQLDGDEPGSANPAGSKFEGIGADERRGDTDERRRHLDACPADHAGRARGRKAAAGPGGAARSLAA